MNRINKGRFRSIHGEDTWEKWEGQAQEPPFPQKIKNKKENIYRYMTSRNPRIYSELTKDAS